MTTYYQLLRRGTIMIPTGPCYHLHVICNDPVFYPRTQKDSVLLVNISTVNPLINYDQTCLLNAGDHPFIKHESYVYYRKADIFGTHSIQRSIADGSFIADAPFRQEVFEQILSGFSTSREVSLKIKRFYENYCLQSAVDSL